MTPTQIWIAGTGIAVIGAVIAHAFYFGSLLGGMAQSLKHIEASLTRNDKEHSDMWARINHATDMISQHMQQAGGKA